MAKKPAGIINARTLTAPIAAVIMAGLLYTYSVTSIRAAKRNAALHRAADGGQLDMRRESLRRHGVLEKVEGTGGVQLFKESVGSSGPKSTATATNNTELKGKGGDIRRRPAREIDRSQELEGRKVADAGEGSGTNVGSRTETEKELEQYKGRGKLSNVSSRIWGSD